MLNVTSGNPEDLLKAGIGLHKAGDLTHAEQVYRQVLAARPNDPVALHLLGTLALDAHQPQAAVAIFEQVLAARPDIADAHRGLATALQEAGRPEEAHLHRRLALELDPPPTPSTAPVETVSADPDPHFAARLAELAAKVAAKGKAATTIRLYERSLDQDPDQPGVLCALGWAYVQARQPEQAAASFRAAMAMNCRTADAYHGLAASLHKSYEFEEALAACREALRQAPDNAEIQWTLAQIEADRYKFEVAANNLRAALAKDPDNQDLRFKLAALTGDRSLRAMPDSQIAATFDKYAADFDSHLVQRLNYKGPQVIRRAVEAVAPGRTFDVLDLGCGTGLCGEAIRPLARSLAGIDLSRGMIERCRQRGIYDDLQVTDVLTALKAHPQGYDLITAADVFDYVGELEEVFRAAAAALRPGGLFAFWVERTDQPGVVLNRTTFRFTHNLEYLLELAQRHGLEKKRVDDTPLRTQFGRPVPCWTLLLQKPG